MNFKVSIHSHELYYCNFMQMSYFPLLPLLPHPLALYSTLPSPLISSLPLSCLMYSISLPLPTLPYILFLTISSYSHSWSLIFIHDSPPPHHTHTHAYTIQSILHIWDEACSNCLSESGLCGFCNDFQVRLFSCKSDRLLFYNYIS